MDANTANKLENLAEDLLFVEEMKDIFFEAMMTGYASAEKIKKSSIVGLPGSKLIPPYIKGPWKVSDPYLVNAPLSSFSGGITVISFEGIPVWMMQYFGRYEEEAIHCLKAALRSAYSRKEFWAGRGPRQFGLDGYYVYKNSIKNPLGLASFAGFFSGEEKVFNKSREILGWHRYQGGGML